MSSKEEAPTRKKIYKVAERGWGLRSVDRASLLKNRIIRGSLCLFKLYRKLHPLELDRARTEILIVGTITSPRLKLMQEVSEIARIMLAKNSQSQLSKYRARIYHNYKNPEILARGTVLCAWIPEILLNLITSGNVQGSAEYWNYMSTVIDFSTTNNFRKNNGGWKLEDSVLRQKFRSNGWLLKQEICTVFYCVQRTQNPRL